MIQKVKPEIPDPWITKAGQPQAMIARFAHLDYLVDSINAEFANIFGNWLPLPNGMILIGGPTNRANPVTVYGDATIDNTGNLQLTHIIPAGMVGSAVAIPIIWYDVKGRIIFTATAPVGVTALQHNHIFVGDALNIASAVAMIGDAGIDDTGTLTISSHVVNYSKMQQVSAVSLLGNPTGVLADVQEILLGTNLSFAGNVLNALGGSPGGLNKQIQFNDGGNFGGSVGITWDKVTHTLALCDIPTGYIGFYGVAPIEQQILPLGGISSVDDIILFLQEIGLVRNS